MMIIPKVGIGIASFQMGKTRSESSGGLSQVSQPGSGKARIQTHSFCSRTRFLSMCHVTFSRKFPDRFLVLSVPLCLPSMPPDPIQACVLPDEIPSNSMPQVSSVRPAQSQPPRVFAG